MNTAAVAYYPEHDDPSRWRSDLELMREAGITAVRVFEFAWSHFELREGQFVFDWAHEFMRLAQDLGMKVVLCTPTAAMPAWMNAKYPETALNHKPLYGTRRNYCFSSELYREFGKRITLRMIEEFRRYPNVIAWQIDNELGFNICHCENCRRRFAGWLKERYGDVASLNREWGLAFWSAEYSDWDHVHFGMNHPEAKLAEARFFSFNVISFLKEFVDLIHAHHPGTLVTTNYMGNFEQIDYWEASRYVDVVGWDFYYELYTMESTSMAHDLMRGLKGQKHWTLENSTGCLGNWLHIDPRLKVMLSIKAWAHGEVLNTHFPWRAFNSGTEQVIWGLLDHADRPTRSYAAAKEMSRLYQLLPDLEMEDFGAQVAVVHSYENYWAFQSMQGMPNYHFVLEGYYKCLNRLGIRLEVIHESADFAKYAVVVFPQYLMCDGQLAGKVRRYVEGGGSVILAPQSFTRDRDLKWLRMPAPAYLTDVFGATVREGCYSANYLGNATSCLGNDLASVDAKPPSHGEYALKSDIAGVAADTARSYFEDIELQGAEAWATYTQGLFAGGVVISANRYGKGLAVRLGCGLSEVGLKALYEHVLKLAGVPMMPPENKDVEIVPLGRHVVVLNHNAHEVREKRPAGRMLLGEAEGEQLHLPAYGFAVIDRVVRESDSSEMDHLQPVVS